jgi:hypothetical protein
MPVSVINHHSESKAAQNVGNFEFRIPFKRPLNKKKTFKIWVGAMY